ncbi:hypothetical protein FQA47_021188 [Oryzias melastigma]|uniref:Uncharacterized protein n=1 Tax=Oryzias melastigma TaxID=30732 RepID=A0A834BZJ6_ORYME|nr:hypothetical protein FQA47_021188 [Oryzias melastigma]
MSKHFHLTKSGPLCKKVWTPLFCGGKKGCGGLQSHGNSFLRMSIPFHLQLLGNNTRLCNIKQVIALSSSKDMGNMKPSKEPNLESFIQINQPLSLSARATPTTSRQLYGQSVLRDPVSDQLKLD